MLVDVLHHETFQLLTDDNQRLREPGDLDYIETHNILLADEDVRHRFLSRSGGNATARIRAVNSPVNTLATGLNTGGRHDGAPQGLDEWRNNLAANGATKRSSS